MSRAAKIAGYVMAAIVAIAIGVTASLSLGTGWRAYTVYGGSMEPHYAEGDLIVTSSSSVADVEPGQIIVFTADWASAKYEQRVVHRVAAVGNVDGVPFAYTRGDANSVDDPQPVNLRTDDVSVVRFSVQNGAFWLDMLTAPYALALIFAGLGIAGTAAALATGRSPLGLRNSGWLRTAQHAPQRQTTPHPEQLL